MQKIALYSSGAPRKVAQPAASASFHFQLVHTGHTVTRCPQILVSVTGILGWGGRWHSGTNNVGEVPWRER
jgi:hypothetical protein